MHTTSYSLLSRCRDWLCVTQCRLKGNTEIPTDTHTLMSRHNGWIQEDCSGGRVHPSGFWLTYPGDLSVDVSGLFYAIYITRIADIEFIVGSCVPKSIEYRFTVPCPAHVGYSDLPVGLKWLLRPSHSMRWRGSLYITFCVQPTWECWQWTVVRMSCANAGATGCGGCLHGRRSA